MRIYKYPVPIEGGAVLMPEGAEILHVHEQSGSLCVWALVDEDSTAPEVSRVFNLYGTGQSVRSPSGKYLGTIHLPQYALVLHVFDMGVEKL